MNDVDERISAALHAAVDGLREQDLRPATAPTGRPSRRTAIRWVAPLLTAAAVAAAIATTFALTGSPSASHRQGQPGGVSSSPPPSPSSSGPGYNCYFDFGPHYACSVPPGYQGFEPLWPFANYDQAHQWQTVDAPNGHSPWHSEAKATAFFFVTGYLQFTDITTVTSVRGGANEQYVGVGYELPSGQEHTAAVIHVVRFSPVFGDSTAGWEVVGATADGLSIDTPKYGDEVTSPVTVGGRITGVDESITVAIRSLDGAKDVSGPIPAGGDNAAWTTTVPYSARQHGALTIVASTGGHLTAHERFAVVGVSASS
jgi:hypothetical protein